MLLAVFNDLVTFPDFTQEVEVQILVFILYKKDMMKP
jgi:hypothetical protein